MSAAPETARTAIRIRVTDTLFLDEIVSLEQCDAAYDELILAVAGIEQQIEADVAPDHAWLIRAKHALRIKKMLLPRVQELRGKLRREQRKQEAATPPAILDRRAEADRLMIRILKEIEPDAVRRARMVAQERYPDAFGPFEAGS